MVFIVPEISWDDKIFLDNIIRPATLQISYFTFK